MKSALKFSACLMLMSLTACQSLPGLTPDSYCQVSEAITFPQSELKVLRQAPEASRGILRENTKRERICL